VLEHVRPNVDQSRMTKVLSGYRPTKWYFSHSENLASQTGRVHAKAHEIILGTSHARNRPTSGLRLDRERAVGSILQQNRLA